MELNGDRFLRNASAWNGTTTVSPVALNTTLTSSKEPSLILKALQYNMLLTSSVAIGLLISILWCICHFVVKWCHSRSLNQYRSQQDANSRFFNSLGIPMSQHPHLTPAQRNAAAQAEMKSLQQQQQQHNSQSPRSSAEGKGSPLLDARNSNDARDITAQTTSLITSSSPHAVQRKQTYEELRARMMLNSEKYGAGSTVTA